MATQEQVKNFIKTLSRLAVTERNRRSKWVLPSVCIAQAALETGWGTSSLMTKANAYFGIKATSSWSGKVYSSKTQECYDGVNYTTITDTFRAYDNIEASVSDYFDLITKNTRYAGAVNNADAESTITAIRNGGYATSPTYVSNIMSIINTYNLTQYDTLDDTTTEAGTSSDGEATNTFAVGDKVKVENAVTYNGVTFALYYSAYDVIQVNGDRVVIGIGSTVTAAVNASNLSKTSDIDSAPVTAEAKQTGLNVNDTVKVVNAVDYYGNAFKCWYDTYEVIEVKNDRVVIGISGIVTAAVNAANLLAAS